MVFHPELPSLIRIQDPSTTQGPAAFPQRGPLVGTTPVYGQQQSNHVLPSAGPRTGTPGMRGHAERLGGHDPGNRMVGDGSGLVGASRRPTRVQRSGCGGRTRADEAVRTQNYIIQRNPGGRRGSATQASSRSGYAGGAEQKFLVDSGGFHRHPWLESTEADTPNPIRLHESTKKLESATANRIRMGQSVQYHRSGEPRHPRSR